MSSIDDQIKALQLKKRKIEYIKYVSDLIEKDTKCIDFQDVQKEIFEKIKPFLESLSESVEKDKEVVQTSEPLLNSEELQALKLVASKVMKSPTPSSTSSVPSKKPVQDLSASDKMNFALENRHLANKRVQVLSDQSSNIFGNVVGIDAPFIIVKTETGPTIQVPLQKVVLI